MREIKFRGMNLCGKWVYGDLRHDRMCMPDGKLQEYISVCGEPISPKSVGQFTGLKDSEGHEIYEGDILSFLPPRMLLTTLTRIIAPVQYRDDGFFVVLSHCDYSLKYILQRDPSAHVIGNIHDNPELLYNDKQSEQSEEVES